MTPHAVFALACLAVALLAGRHALSLFLDRRPAAGVVIANSYSDERRRADRFAHPGDRLFRDSDAAEPTVEDILTVAYEVDGRRHVATFATEHRRGDRADSAPIVWYDPHRPDRVTLDGPGRQAVLMLVALGLAAVAATGLI